MAEPQTPRAAASSLPSTSNSNSNSNANDRKNKNKTTTKTKTKISDAPPPLAALFLVKFDQKVGYTIAWKRSSSSSNVPLEGIVEFKSLPSGLHNVQQDLVYFTHERWAGVSAFKRAEAGEGERGARFVSVGALVSLGDARLGRVWEYASDLVGLSERLVESSEDVEVLERFWDTYGSPSRVDDDDKEEEKEDDEDEEDDDGGHSASPFTLAQRKSRNRNRALSSLTLSGPAAREVLPEYHPAHSIMGYLDCFGPLVFTLHRLALLRKRILLCASPPVRSVCEFVYDLSIFSSLPHSLSYIPPTYSMTRLRPLFNVGIHDIPYLTELGRSASTEVGEEADKDPLDSNGWIASTTDEILAMKPQLYDILVELPHSSISQHPGQTGRKSKNKGVGLNRWPVLKHAATGEEIKATQRDLRRYRSLRRTLAPLTGRQSDASLDEDETDAQDHIDGDAEDEETHLLFSSMHGNFADSGEEEHSRRRGEEKVTEAVSWSELAYGGFIWWASAGEKEEGLKTEDEIDALLLGSLPEAVLRETRGRGYRDSDSDDEDDERQGRPAEIEMSLVGYFHRISKAIFETVEAVLSEKTSNGHDVPDPPSDEDNNEEAGGEDEAEDEEDDAEQHVKDDHSVKFESEDLRRCGLDLWSEQDSRFITEFVDLWFGREVSVRRIAIECCGVRLI